MTIFDIACLAALIFGLIHGADFGSRFGSVGSIVGAIFGGTVGLILGRVPFFLALKLGQRNLSNKTVEDLRSMLLDSEEFAPNIVLLELGSRGEDLEQDLPVVLDMLVAPSKERRRRGWHALASAFPERAELISEYRIDDTLEECRRKTLKLRSAEPDAVSNDTSSLNGSIA